MAVRPFFTMIFFQELFGLDGSKNVLEKFHQAHNLKISNRLLRSKTFFQKNISDFIFSVCVPFLGSEPVTTEGIRVSWTNTDVRRY